MAHRELGYAYAKQGRFADATTEALTALRLDRNDTPAQELPAILQQR